MSQEVYADKVSNIYVNGDTVRIDFVSLNPALQDKDGNLVYNHAARIVIPLAGFMEGFSLGQNVIGQLVDKGAITITPQQQPVSPVEQPVNTEDDGHEG
ncbi:hypothetical protein SDC9_11388 [bioreactor metagenome]|uniref:Uncharacterized protein n=1 Tax=bioreactor metagenome TaxID=1076179 RepID=A0A644TFV7_9ZZZZ